MTAVHEPRDTVAALGKPGQAAKTSGQWRRRTLLSRVITHACLVVGVLLSIFPF
jgi:cellobiose transport system permease protein